MKNTQKVDKLIRSLNAVQGELVRGHISKAKAFAAKLEYELNEFNFDLMRIPPSERQKYRCPSAYYRH